MIVGTSAILAILVGEPDAGRYETAMAAAWPSPHVSGGVGVRSVEVIYLPRFRAWISFRAALERNAERVMPRRLASSSMACKRP